MLGVPAGDTAVDRQIPVPSMGLGYILPRICLSKRLCTQENNEQSAVFIVFLAVQRPFVTRLKQ